MNDCNRRLIHVPILHCPADMGSLREGLEAVYVEQFGRRRWQEHLALIDKFWRSVRTGLDELDLDYRRVDLYQDGLPVCGKELEIVRETAARGSENYQLLMDLISRGATLIGTEEVKLLLEEYRSLKEGLATKLSDDRSAKGIGSDAARAAEILAARDAYIGRRIAETLVPGRTGILFMGMMHKVDAYLPGDILITRLRLDVAGNQDKGNSSG
jgi:hypothetical protein